MNGWMKTERAMLQSQYGPFSFSVRTPALSASMPERRRRDVFGERGVSERRPERFVQGAPVALDDLGRPVELVRRGMASAGTFQEHTAQTGRGRFHAAPHGEGGHVRAPAVVPRLAVFSMLTGFASDDGRQLVRHVGRRPVVERVPFGHDEADRPPRERQLTGRDTRLTREFAQPPQLRGIWITEHMAQVTRHSAATVPGRLPVTPEPHAR